MKKPTALRMLVCAVPFVIAQSAWSDEPATDQTVEQKSTLEQIGDDISEGLTNTGTVATIMAKYAADPLLGFFKLQVYAEGDHVTLKGDLNTNMQYQRAVILALNTEGVNSVDASGVKINESDTPVADLFLTASVQYQLMKMGLFSDVDTDKWSVQIESKEGSVYVSGTADSQETKDKILLTIHQVEGVKDVKDAIEVKP